jgi:proline dehydrogenase
MDKKELRRGDKRIYFAQLYGMSDNITYTLANEGYNVCKYIPYAPVRKVLPYLFRRIRKTDLWRGKQVENLS